MSINGNYNKGEVPNVSAELRALKEGESDEVKGAIENIIALHKKQNESLAQFPFDDPIYDELNANYSVLLTAINPDLKKIASDYLYNPMNYDEQMAPTQPVNRTGGGRRRRHKHKTMKRRRSTTKRRHQRKTGRRNRRT